MLPTADTYERLVDPFEWHIPQQYNIGIDTCDKCADRSGRLALICETHEGQLTPYAFDQLKQLSDGFAHALQCDGVQKRGHCLLRHPAVRTAAVASFCRRSAVNRDRQSRSA